MAVVLVMLLLITGILLKLVYEPFPGTAYDSIILIQNDVWFGQLVRNIHHWSANILVIVVLPHMLRVFFTGALAGLGLKPGLALSSNGAWKAGA